MLFHTLHSNEVVHQYVTGEIPLSSVSSSMCVQVRSGSKGFAQISQKMSFILRWTVLIWNVREEFCVKNFPQ